MNIRWSKSQSICRVNPAQRKPGVLCRVAGWLVLALYLLEYSPVGIYAAALGGSFDSSHEVRVHWGEQGLQLVLHHNHGCFGHHHGIVARTLTLFAQPATTANPDHVIQFGSNDGFSSPTQIAPPKFASAGLPLPVLNNSFLVLPSVTLGTSEVPRPPPALSGLFASLRSTVILI